MEKLFVLGGRDAEMWEIEKVLKKQNVIYRWHPSVLSHWASTGKTWIDIENDRFPVDLIEYKEFESIYFVECRPDKQIQNAVIIDHHGEMAENPPSLLQVLDILGLEPTHDQQIIAFDDAGGLKNIARHMGKKIAMAHAIKNPPTVLMDEMDIKKRYGYWAINMEYLTRAVEASRRIFIEHGGDYPTLVFFDSSSDEVKVFTSSGEIARKLKMAFGGRSGGAALYDSNAPEYFWGGCVKKRDRSLVVKIVKSEVVI